MQCGIKDYEIIKELQDHRLISINFGGHTNSFIDLSYNLFDQSSYLKTNNFVVNIINLPIVYDKDSKIYTLSTVEEDYKDCKILFNINIRIKRNNHLQIHSGKDLPIEVKPNKSFNKFIKENFYDKLDEYYRYFLNNFCYVGNNDLVPLMEAPIKLDTDYYHTRFGSFKIKGYFIANSTIGILGQISHIIRNDIDSIDIEEIKGNYINIMNSKKLCIDYNYNISPELYDLGEVKQINCEIDFHLSGYNLTQFDKLEGATNNIDPIIVANTDLNLGISAVIFEAFAKRRMGINQNKE